MFKVDVSIVICTHNRSALLRSCLDNLVKLIVPPDITWEVVLVNNNSTDATSGVVRELKESLRLNYIFESKVGKAYALNTAIENASGQLMLFCDDDIRPTPGWLNQFWRASEKYGHEYWLGGRVIPDWQLTRKPKWFNDRTFDNFSGNLGIHDYGTAIRPYDSSHLYPIGASMAIPRNIVNTVGKFRTNLGPRGPLRGTGEDTDYISRAQKSGYRGIYVGTSLAHHFVDPARLSVKGFYEYGYMKGRNSVRCENDKYKPSVLAVLDQSLRGINQFILGRQGNFRVCVQNIGFQRGLKAERKSDSCKP